MASGNTVPDLQQEHGTDAVERRSERTRHRLRTVRRVALVDLVLLVALVSSSLTDRREFVQVLGPLHGVNFLLLLVVAATAALDGLWGWWFPGVILITAGPPGAFVGEWVISRRMATDGVIDNPGTTARAEARSGDTAASGAVSQQAQPAEEGPGERGGRG